MSRFDCVVSARCRRPAATSTHAQGSSRNDPCGYMGGMSDDGRHPANRRRGASSGLWRQAMRLTLETRQRPWDPAGLETRWTSATQDGAFRVRVCHPAETADRAVVLIHGVIVSGRYLTPLGAALSRDFAVAIPDLPGYGLSQAAMPGQTLAELAD